MGSYFLWGKFCDAVILLLLFFTPILTPIIIPHYFDIAFYDSSSPVTRLEGMNTLLQLIKLRSMYNIYLAWFLDASKYTHFLRDDGFRRVE